MQTEHYDYLMSHPQPQVNPPGPNVYETQGTILRFLEFKPWVL